MEKTCEFCGAPRPIVYCQPDGAFLCLSCDAKVHSANALSSRHSRTLLCDSCRYKQAFVRCLDHLMLLCKNCDSRLHKGVPQHRKLTISSFTGCPTAKHFAALWGVDSDELDEFAARGEHGSGSCMSTDMTGADLKSLESAVEATGSCAQPETSYRNRQYNCKKQSNYQKDQKNCLIMQQILDLKKLQLTETVGHLPLLQRHGDPVTSSSISSAQGILNEGLDQQLKDLDYITNNLQSHDDSDKMLKGDHFTSPTSQLHHSSNPSSVEDHFWQDKFPADNSQFWTQHIQDLGVWDELGSIDDFNIPDVDVSFRNFEDLFNNDTGLAEPLLEDHDLMWSDIEKATRQDTSRTSSISANEELYLYDHIANKLSINLQNANMIESSNSASFFSSRLSVESSGSECQDSGNSGRFVRGERLSSVAEVQCSIRPSKEGKKARLHGRQTQLSPRKSKVDVHKRSKGRCIKIEGYESEAANSAKSY